MLSLAAVSEREERAEAASPKSCPSIPSKLQPVRSRESREEDQRTACMRARSCSTRTVELARERKPMWRTAVWNKDGSTWIKGGVGVKGGFLHLCQCESCQGEWVEVGGLQVAKNHLHLLSSQPTVTQTDHFPLAHCAGHTGDTFLGKICSQFMDTGDHIEFLNSWTSEIPCSMEQSPSLRKRGPIGWS